MTLTPSVRAMSLCSFPCVARPFACASFVAISTLECLFLAISSALRSSSIASSIRRACVRAAHSCETSFDIAYHRDVIAITARDSHQHVFSELPRQSFVECHFLDNQYDPAWVAVPHPSEPKTPCGWREWGTINGLGK